MADFRGQILSFQNRKRQEHFIPIRHLTGLHLWNLRKVHIHNVNYVLILYFLNLIMVSIDTFLYYRNRRLDRIRDQEEVIIVENISA